MKQVVFLWWRKKAAKFLNRLSQIKMQKSHASDILNTKSLKYLFIWNLERTKQSFGDGYQMHWWRHWCTGRWQYQLFYVIAKLDTFLLYDFIGFNNFHLTEHSKLAQICMEARFSNLLVQFLKYLEWNRDVVCRRYTSFCVIIKDYRN